MALCYKRIYNTIDLVKFLAAFLVVAIHTRPFYTYTVIDYYFTCLCRVAVPFFFISTSFFFFSKETPDIKKYTKRLLTLYLVWFVIEIPFVYHRFFIAYDQPLSLQILNFFRCLVFNNTWYASWYIMACIIGVNIIYWLSRKLNNEWLLAIGITGYIVSLLCSSYSGVFDLYLPEKILNYHTQFEYMFMPANSFIVALLYVVLGKIVAERVKKEQLLSRHKNLTFLVIICLLFGVEVHILKSYVSFNDTFLFLPILVLCGFLLLLQTSIIISSETSLWLRNMSILIYILHPIFVVINSVLLGLSYGGGLFVITLLESIIGCSLVIKVSNKVQVLKILY